MSRRTVISPEWPLNYNRAACFQYMVRLRLVKSSPCNQQRTF